LAAVLVAVSGARATAADENQLASSVKDGASLFSPAAVARADEQIAQIRKTYGCDLVLETVEALPKADRRWFRFLYAGEVNRRLADWARERARDEGVEGIYVVVCRKPRSVIVVVYPPAQEQTFTPSDCAQLQRQLAYHLGRREPDQALLDGVSEARNLLEARRRENAAPPTNLVLVGGIIAGVLGFWVALGLMLRGLGVADTGSAYQELRRRGVLLPALLGSMFGVTAGYWIYDQLFLAGSRATTTPAKSEPVPETIEEFVSKDKERVTEAAGDESQGNTPVEEAGGSGGRGAR
jgi:hypothetical protein